MRPSDLSTDTSGGEENPFLAPKAKAAAAAEREPAEWKYRSVYRSASSWARTARAVLGVFLGIYAVRVLFVFVGIGLTCRSPSNQGGILDVLQTVSLQQTVTIFVYLAAMFVFAIAFFTWFYRVYRNLPALRAARIRYSPGWAVGFWFIPVVNCFRPYQATIDIWDGSDPRLEPQPAVRRSHRYPRSWWIVHLFYGLGLPVLSFTGLEAEMTMNNQLVVFAVWGNLGQCVVGAIYAILLLRVIGDIDKRQTARAEKIFNTSDAGGDPQNIRFANDPDR